MATVVFARDAYSYGGYTVKFRYDPDLVELIKAVVPSYARTWRKADKCWTVDNRYDASQLAAAMRRAGHTVITPGSREKTKSSTSSSTNNSTDDPAGWAMEMLISVGPTRSDQVFRALTKVLHPDNQQTGDTALQRELNQARHELGNE